MYVASILSHHGSDIAQHDQCLHANRMLIWVTQQMLINSYPRFPKSKLRLEIKVLKKADLLVLFANAQRHML